jgi:hypothetical protein
MFTKLFPTRMLAWAFASWLLKQHRKKKLASKGNLFFINIGLLTICGYG